MSTDAMAQCWGKNFPTETGLPLSASTIRLVALAVADVVNDLHNNLFYASMGTLAGKVDLSRETVGLVMKHLCDTGVLAQVEAVPGRPTKYRWLGVTDAPTGGGDGTIRQVPVGTIRQGVSEPSDTKPIEPKKETKEPRPTQSARPAVITTDFGGSGEEAPVRPRKKRRREVHPDEGGKPPAVRSGDLMDYFVLEWSTIQRERPEFAMVPVYAVEKACYSWLRTRFLGPQKGGKAWKPEEVLRLMEEFMREVRYGAITPKPGINAWQMFQSSHTKYVQRVKAPETPMANYETSEFAQARRDETRQFLESMGLTSS